MSTDHNSGRTDHADGTTADTMMALVYGGAGKRAWQSMPRPVIRDPATPSCASPRPRSAALDLHIMKGDVPTVTPGRILGHEGIGIIDAVGAQVSTICGRRQGADLVHQRMRQMRCVPQGDVFALPQRRLDPRQHHRRDAGGVRAHAARRDQPLPPAGGR